MRKGVSTILNSYGLGYVRKGKFVTQLDDLDVSEIDRKMAMSKPVAYLADFAQVLVLRLGDQPQAVADIRAT